MGESAIAVRVRNEDVGIAVESSLLTKARMSILRDRIDVVPVDFEEQVRSIPRSALARVELRQNPMTRKQQLVVPAVFGLIIGGALAVLPWIVVLIKGQIAIGVVQAILATVALILFIAVLVTIYNLPKIAWAPHVVVALVCHDGTSLDLFVREDKASAVMTRLGVHPVDTATYSMVIIVGEISDTPLFHQAEDQLVRAVGSAPRHPLAADVEFVTERVAALPSAERTEVEPFVWVLQTRHGKRGGAWQVDFHDPMGFSFMVVYLE